MPGLSELEGCVLGLVGCRGPLTAYAIRRVFLDSVSPHWSGSAGAIYPLIRRLAKRGLIRSRTHAIGSRRGHLHSLTAAGRSELRRWMGPPLPDWVVAVPVDSLRTRLGFLSALPPDARLAFLDDARRRLRAHVRDVEEDCRLALLDPDPCRILVARGALAMLRARSRWLSDVARTMAARPRRGGGRDRVSGVRTASRPSRSS